MNVRVFGIGADVAHVPRFQRAFARYGDRFLRRAFHPDEIREFYCKPPAARASFLASRWAVKEAAFKAFQRYRVLFPEICVARQESDESAAAVASVFNVVTQLSVAETPRALRLEFSGKTALLAEQLGLVEPHVSISHDEDYAVAYVVLQQKVVVAAAAATAPDAADRPQR